MIHLSTSRRRCTNDKMSEKTTTIAKVKTRLRSRPRFICSSSSSSSWIAMTFYFVFLSMALFSLPMSVHAQEEYTLKQLEAMSEQELEEICVMRGFQLVKDEKDPETGQQYQLTHGDYVEAAQRCLAIEKEMNELLNEYPELAEELEEELKKMEEENAAKQAELAELQSRLDEAQRTEDGSESATGSKAAFVSSTNTEQETGEEPSQGSVVEKDVDDTDKYDFIITETTDEEDDTVLESGIPEEGPQDDERQDVPPSRREENTISSTTDVTTKTRTTAAEDFTLTHLAIETLRAFVQHAKDDVKRLVGMMVPVVQPLFTAGDVAWRQIKALFVKARDAYYAEPEEADATKKKEDTQTT